MNVRNWFKSPEAALHSLVVVAVVVAVAGVAVGGVSAANAAIVGFGSDSAQLANLSTGDVVATKVESLEETPAIDVSSLTKAATKIATPLVAPKPRAAVAAVKQTAAKQTAAAQPAATGGWKSARVSWYGPGFYGNTMAGGGTLTPSSMVVAHRSMRFGTKIEFSYNGRTCVAVVQDRGPFVGGRTFDLGPGTAKALGFSGVGTVRWRIVQ